MNELLYEIQARAINSGWDLKQTQLAVAKTTWVTEQLGTKLHKPKGVPNPLRPFPLPHDPQVLAARLHMLAVMAFKHQGGKDDKGLVAYHAEELVRRWPKDTAVLDLYPDAMYARKEEMSYLLDRRTYVRLIAPVLNGLLVASKVVEPALAEPLKVIAGHVQRELDQALTSEAVQAPGNRALATYNRLFNSTDSLCTLDKTA